MASRQSPEQQKSVTMKDIAVRCGVDVSTVSRALRDPERHSEATTQRVLAAAKELGYDPAAHQAARRLVMRRFGKQLNNHLIALLFPPFFYRANYFAEMFQGILDVLTPEGYGLLTVDTGNSSNHPLPASFSSGDVDGVIAVADSSLTHTLKYLWTDSSHHCPVVSLILPHAGCSSVAIDFQGAAYTAAAHLLDLGHRHILQFQANDVNAPDATSNPKILSLAGYQQAFLDRGLDPAQYLHFHPLDHKLQKYAFVAMSHPKLAALSASTEWASAHPLLKELRRCPEITAMLAPNDPSAIIIRYMLRAGGYRVPEDFSLVGFDDSDPLLDEQGKNMLTTMRIPLRQVGRRAARLIINRVTGRAKKEQQVLLTSTLIIRGSTAPPLLK